MSLLKLNFKNRVEEFVPEVIKEVLGDKAYLTGGAIRAYINKEDIKDFDIFILQESLKESIKDKLLAKGFKVAFECPAGKLVTLKKKKLKVQIIYNENYKTPEDIINSFDFTIAQFVLIDNILLTTTEALRDTLKRRIRLNVIHYPAATLGRFYKYQKRGYRLDEETKKDFVQRLINQSQEIIDEELVYID